MSKTSITQTIFTIIGAFVTGLVIGIFIVALISLPVMWLWNWLMPVIFGLPEIALWQTVGLLFLIRFLFGQGSVKLNS